MPPDLKRILPSSHMGKGKIGVKYMWHRRPRGVLTEKKGELPWFNITWVLTSRSKMPILRELILFTSDDFPEQSYREKKLANIQ